MKKRALVFLAIIGFISCNLDDDQGTQFEFTPIAEVIVPQTLIPLQKGDTFSIRVDYANPSACHSFDTFITTGTATEPKITLVTKTDVEDCTLLGITALSSATFNFIIGDASSYVLQFWQGQNDAGVDQFITIEVPITQ